MSKTHHFRLILVCRYNILMIPFRLAFSETQVEQLCVPGPEGKSRVAIDQSGIALLLLSVAAAPDAASSFSWCPAHQHMCPGRPWLEIWNQV